MALIKSSHDLSLIRIAGRKLAAILQKAEAEVKPGITSNALDHKIAQWIKEEGCTPSFLGYDGFPNASCISINEQVVHGIPSDRVLKEGDIVGIDVGLWYEGVCTDGAITVPVGTVAPEVTELLRVTKRALETGIKATKPFRRVGAISHSIQECGEKAGYGIVRSLTGHGVGHNVHEAPEIPNYGDSNDGIILKPGMVLAIEPMFTLGSADVLTEIDGWGVITADHSYAAHFEHTVIVTARGVEITTLPLAQ